MATTRSGFALKKFSDAGLGKNYKAGDKIDGLDEGTYLNYERAGLVGEHRPGTAAAESDKAAKPAA